MKLNSLDRAAQSGFQFMVILPYFILFIQSKNSEIPDIEAIKEWEEGQYNPEINTEMEKEIEFTVEVRRNTLFTPRV